MHTRMHTFKDQNYITSLVALASSCIIKFLEMGGVTKYYKVQNHEMKNMRNGERFIKMYRYSFYLFL